MPHLFLPYHLFAIEQALVIRTRESAAAIGPAVKAAVESLGTRRPVYDIQPMQAYADASIGDARFMMLMLVGFGAAALLLTAVGLYGTLAYLTSQRTQEFGIRMALGASRWQVLRSVAGEGLLLAAVGGVLGFAGAMATTGILRGLLYDVTPFDATTLGAAALIMALTALAAATEPAWRAARVDPTIALRAE
ncbi:MAG: FtsX-like permease family protein [Acidobacteria bacterium]|nr:FtsX-like permease family protein [Acidobacteriota bacterium]